MVDESTDRANRKRLLAYVQYFHDNQLKTNLLENIEITTAKADAETITAKILQVKYKQEFRGRRHRTCWRKSHRSHNQNVVIK